jgi:predicted aspartyl protease
MLQYFGTMRAILTRLLLLVAAAMFIGGCSTVSQRIQAEPEAVALRDRGGNEADTVTIPSRRCANYFLIDARLNGRGPFTFILDTGSSQTVVAPHVARLLKDDSRPVDMYAEGSQGRRQDVSSVIRVRELEIGDARLSGFEAIALDLSQIQATLGTNIDGILGYPAFRDVLLTVDYPGSAIRIARGDLPRPDGRSVVALTSRDRPTVEVRIDSHRRTLLLDTGKAGAFSLSDFDDQNFKNPPITIAMGVAVGGAYEMRSGRLASDITLGDVVFQRPIVERSSSSDLIGAEAMKTFAVTFDQRNRRVRFAGSGQRTVTFEPLRGIGVGFDFTRGNWNVARVFPGLPAESVGLQPGDSIIRLGGRRLREFACTRPLDLFNTGDAIDVSVIRERHRLDFHVPIITLVP